MEFFALLLEHLAWIEHQFLSGIRDSRKAGSLCRMMRGVGGVRKSIHQSWLAKGLGLGLLCWGFKGLRKRFRRKRPACFKSGQWHFHQDMHHSTTLSLSQTIWPRWVSHVCTINKKCLYEKCLETYLMILVYIYIYIYIINETKPFQIRDFVTFSTILTK